MNYRLVSQWSDNDILGDRSEDDRYGPWHLIPWHLVSILNSGLYLHTDIADDYYPTTPNGKLLEREP